MFKKSNSGSRFGGRGRGGDRGRDAERPEMHRATCADCGQSCEVPFKPNGSRPVFCRECFKGNQGGGQGEARGERDFEEKQFFDAECATCGDECTVPFKPKAGRPIFCRDCMGKKDKPQFPRENREDRGFSISKEQYEALAAKVDKILKIVQGSQTYTVKKEEVAVTVPAKITASQKIKAKGARKKG